MFQPDLYRKANVNSRFDEEQIIKEFFGKMQWRTDGADALLDIGTGPGDVLMELIYSRMPANFERVVGTDVTNEMVDYAKECYKTRDKCDFRLLDMGMEDDLPQDLKHKFDHVTSFYAFHWLPDQRQAFGNIFKLLRKEGGDCLLVFLANYPIFDVYKTMSQSPKWSEYMKDADQVISPYQYVHDPKTKCSDFLKEAGFSDVRVDLRHTVYGYEGIQTSKDLFKAINPFLKRIPTALHDEYMDDLFNITISYDSSKAEYLKELETLKLSYDLLVVYARK